MSKQGYEVAPSAPLPTAPPPPYDTQPPYNPGMQAVSAMPPYQYQPAPVIHEMPAQGSHVPYPTQPHYQQPGPTVNTQTRVVVGPLMVGPQSLRTTCPNCQATIQTRTSKVTRGIAHLFCLGLCVISCCLCSWVPYCLDSLKEVRHTCPKCKAHLGTYRT